MLHAATTSVDRTLLIPDAGVPKKRIRADLFRRTGAHTSARSSGIAKEKAAPW
jgi:hypothetical protein